MAIPQGNFVALQALKPKEYKIGDLYLQMTDYLIKKGEAQKAAQLKAAEERNKYWDEVGKEFKIEAVNSAGRINVLTEKIFKNAWDENDKNKRILQDRSGYYSEADKELARQRLTNIHKNYIAFTTSVSDPNLIKDVNAKLEKVNSGNYFKLDPDLAKNAAVEMGIYDAEMNQDGDIKVYSPTTFGSNDVSAQDWNEFLTAYRTPPADDLVNGKNGVYQLLLDEGSKIKDDWERGDGVTTKSITQFSKQRGETFFNSLIGEKYNPNIHTPKSAWGQLAVTSFGLPELNEKTWDEFKKKTLETMAIQAENASKVNVKLPSGGGNGNGNVRTGGGGSGSDNEPTVADNVLQLIPTTTGRVTNYQQSGVMIRGAAKIPNQYNRISGEEIKKDVWIQTYWGGGKGKENLYFALALPTQSGGFIMKPLSSRRDPRGFEAARKYLTNTDVDKLVKRSNEYFSNPQNRQFGRLITEQLPEDYNQVDFSSYFNTQNNQSKPQIKTTSRK